MTDPRPIVLARLPRTGAIPTLLLVTMIGGPGLLRPEFSVLWLLRFFTVALVIMRSMQVRLLVTSQVLEVTNFFRTIRIPLPEVRVPLEQPRVGYLEVLDGSGTRINVGAAPSWGADLEALRDRLNLAIAERRGW